MRKLLTLLCDCFFSTPSHRWGRQAGFAAWVPAIIAAGEAVVNNVNANRAQGQADTAQGQANGIAQQELGLATNEQANADQLLSRYDNVFEPVQNQLIQQSIKGIDPNEEAGQAVEAVSEQAAGQKQAMLNQEARYGINPDSGSAIAANSNFDLGTAAAKAGAANTARRYATNETLDRLAMVSNMGNPLIGAAEGMEGQAGGTLGGVNGYYGALAGRENALAGGFGQAAGFGLADFMNEAPMYSGPGGLNYLNTTPPNTSSTTLPIDQPYQPPN